MNISISFLKKNAFVVETQLPSARGNPHFFSVLNNLKFIPELCVSLYCAPARQETASVYFTKRKQYLSNFLQVKDQDKVKKQYCNFKAQAGLL